jgi:hypothetical protein
MAPVDPQVKASVIKVAGDMTIELLKVRQSEFNQSEMIKLFGQVYLDLIVRLSLDK